MTFNLQHDVVQSVRERRIDHRIWWLAIAALLGIALYVTCEHRVFPSASIDLKLSRRTITKISNEWAYELGYRKQRPIRSTQFSPDYDGKTFLEYELGSLKANQLMKEQLPIWSWRTRFCKEHEFEEFRTWLSPGGKLYGFVHEIENNRALPSLPKKEAEALARQFIEIGAGINLSGYKIVKSSSYSQLHRTDHSFTWEDTEQDFQGARLRVQATVSGNLLTQFSYFLYVPETWERKFSTIRSYNNLLESIATIFYTLIQYLSIFVFIWAVTSNRIRWRFSVLIALALTAVNAIESFNDIASVIDDYNTHEVYYGYLLQFVLQTLSGTLSQFINNLLLVGAAEAIYRATYPQKIAMENFFSASGIRSKSLALCLFLAYLLTAIDLGWVVLYYLGGEKLQFWCPLGVDNYQILSTVVPCFSAVAIGVSASVTEELMYRVMALSVAQKITRNFWFANLFQAAAWGFMHSTYPQQPAYARGVELTIGGLFHGWILRRYGILPSIVSHYLFDAFLDVKPLFSSGDFWLKASAFLPVVPFALLALWSVYKIGKAGAAQESPLANEAVPLSYKNDDLEAGVIAEEGGRFEYVSLSPKLRIFLCILALSSLALASPIRKQPGIGSDAHVIISRAQALDKAKQCLVLHNVTEKDKMAVVWLSNHLDDNELQYVFEKEQLKRTLELARPAKQHYIWKTRFFKELDPEEYEVVMDQSGKPISFSVVRAEDAPGARLSFEQAKKKAEEYLASSHSAFWPYEFDNVTENQRKGRTDYTFYYKVPKLKVSDADFKISTSIIGDTVSGFDSGWDVPDNWLNERNKKRVRDEILLYLRTALNLIVFVAVLRWAFSVLKSGQITWRNTVACAIALIAMLVLKDLNDLPVFFRSYFTTSPMTSYIIRSVVSFFESDFATFAFSIVGLAFALAGLKMLSPNFNLASYGRFLFRPGDAEHRRERRELWLDAILVTATAGAVHLLITSAQSFAKAQISPHVPLDAPSSLCSVVNVAFPSFDFSYDALIAGFNALLMVTLAASLYRRYCRNFYVYMLLTLVWVGINYSSHRYWQDYLIDVLASYAQLLLAWFATARLIGFNPLTYFLIGFESVLLSRLFLVIDHGLPLLAGQLIILILAMLSPCLYLLVVYWRDHLKKRALVQEN
ncbi:MAG: hypothetical protein C5B53_03860 [Candidatus Melainabacteria bacterium]|nr:MAG: hypothetical protein C5B53_03860 [Candidatus Melainabacteria bacterium]